MPLQIAEVGPEGAPERYQITDERGRYVESFPGRPQAEAFLAGYRCGRMDAAAIVRNQADALAKIGTEG